MILKMIIHDLSLFKNKTFKDNKMKRILQNQLVVVLLCMVFLSCDDGNEEFPLAATLKVVHAASGVPDIHVDYFGSQGDMFTFNANRPLRFSAGERFTIPANEARTLRFTYATDTTVEVFSDNVQLEAGQITTYYITGDSAILSGFLLTETFQNYTDSVFGVNFVNAATDLANVGLRVIQTDTAGVNDTTIVFSTIGSGTSTGFGQYEATGRIEEYTFEYINASDSVLADFSIDPLRRRREKVFKNITVPLIGTPDDGEGNSALRTTGFDNFD